MSGLSYDNINVIFDNTRNEDNTVNFLTYPSQVNTETGCDDNNSSVFSQSKNEGKNIQFNMSESQLFEEFTDKKFIDNDIYNQPSDYPLKKPYKNSGNKCPIFSVSKNCNAEPLIQIDPKNKNISEHKESRINKSQFSKIGKTNGDNDNNYSPSEDRDSQNKTKINKQNSLMDTEDDSAKNNQRKDKSDELRKTTVRNINNSLYNKIVIPLIGKISNYHIWRPNIGKEQLNKEDLAKFCNQIIFNIFLEAEPCHHSEKGKKENKKKINELYEISKNNEDNINCKTFKDLMDLPFIDLIIVYYDKTYSDNSELPENLKNIGNNKLFENLEKKVNADFEIDFKNKDKKKICKKRKKALLDFILFAKKIRKPMRFIISKKK